MPKTILVVDDERGILDLVEAILSRQGYRILVADSGLKALEIYHGQHNGVDLLLTDIMMPGMSGLELGRSLKTLGPHVPILYMTGGTLEGVNSRELDGRSELVMKPFDPLLLINKVRSIFDAK